MIYLASNIKLESSMYQTPCRICPIQHFIESKIRDANIQHLIESKIRDANNTNHDDLPQTIYLGF